MRNFTILIILISILSTVNSQSLLIEAINQNDYETIDKILDTIKNVNYKVSDEFGTPLQYALKINTTDIKIIEKLLKAGANPNLDLHIEGECYLCDHMPIETAINKKNYDAIELLIKYNANIDTVVELTAIQYAVLLSDTVAINILINNGANLYLKDISGTDTPISIAVRWSNYKILNYLIKNKTNITDDPDYLYWISMSCCGDGFGQDITDKMRLKTITILYENGVIPTKKTIEYAEYYKNSRPIYYNFFMDKKLINK